MLHGQTSIKYIPGVHINKIETEIHLSNIKNFLFYHKRPGLPPLQRPATVMLFRGKNNFLF
jgi:hypothetical protein